jgi:Protein of unknown function (DUF2690)
MVVLRQWLVVVLSALVAASVSLASATPAAAVSLCYSSPSSAHCDGTNPETTGCAADGVTLRTADIRDNNNNRVGVVQLRSSAHCRTRWARVYNYYGQTTTVISDVYNANGANIPAEVDTVTNGQSAYSMQTYVGTGGSAQGHGVVYAWDAWTAFD